MISMTGYGYAEHSDEKVSSSVEIKSVNNRYLDISISLPGGLSRLEPRVRAAVSETVARGRVDITIRLQEGEEQLAVSVDRGALSGYLAALNELKDAAGVTEPISISHLLRLEGVLRVERERDIERYWALVQPLLEQALTRFVAARRREGQALARDIGEQLSRIAAGVDAIEAHAGEIEEGIHRSLRERFAEVVGESVEEGRMLAEVAVQLARFNINEEVVRLRAHLQAIHEMIDSAQSGVGKRLDFICQEINREINTIGSKSVVLEISQRVIDAKDALESVREQVRNLE